MDPSITAAAWPPGAESHGSGLPGGEIDPKLDLAARSRMASLRASMFGASAEPARVGRFVVLETLGAGGMGVVHAAYDPRLDRKIALKLVKPEVAAAGTNGEARLLREAQAMARLSHPNVVQIHEVGAWEGRVFIAMELVAGRSLATWLEAQPRGWREVVHMFAEAGRGLAAAHAAGMVHRDFKPENVLVGDDGRVRVTDFGLARGGVSESGAGETWREPGDPLAAIVEGMSVGTAAFAGTPRFMSPEQFLGEPATAASDQFSFCVALYVALHGVHPFVGEDRATLAKAVIAGERREPPRMRVPRKIHKAVVKGLARAPGARFAGMGELLRAIEPRAGWQRVAPMALFAVTGAGAAGVLYESDPCEDTNALLGGVWAAEQRAATQQAFVGSAVPDADVLWESAANELDVYVDAVAESYVASCKKRRLGTNSPELHDLRVECLSRRVEVVRGVVDALRSGQPDALRSAPQAVTGLDTLEACADDRALLLGIEPPPVSQVEAVARVKHQVDRARSLELVGYVQEGRDVIEAALQEARALDYGPILAEALYQRGRLDVLESEFPAAEEALREALKLAFKTGHDVLVGELWTSLIHAAVVRRGEARGAEEMLQYADAWLGRTGASPVRQAELERTRGIVFQVSEDFVAAEEASRHALEIRESLNGPDGLQAAIERYNHANSLDMLGRTEEAIASYRRAIRGMEAKVGPAHSLVADVYYNLAVALLRSTEPAAVEEARAGVEHAKAIVLALRGEGAIDLASYHVILAQIAERQGDGQEAARQVDAALRVYEHHPTHPDRSVPLGYRGTLRLAEGRLDEAFADHIAARKIGLDAWGEGSEAVRVADLNLGDVLKAKGDLPGASLRYASAIAGIEGTLGSESAELIEPLYGLGEVELAVGRACEAVAAFERALRLGSGNEIDGSRFSEIEAARSLAREGCRQDDVD